MQENREREATEKRRKHRESMRIASKRHSTVSCTGPEPDQDSSSLESVLHSFLSTTPLGYSRYRKSMLSPIKGSTSDSSFQALPSVGKTEDVVFPAENGHTQQERPEKKQAKLQKEDQEAETKEEALKMRELTRKVLRYQSSRSSLNGDRLSDSPQSSERVPGAPSTPSTPRPRTRDFFFASNGDVGSPWTIVSPFTCVVPRNRREHLQGPTSSKVEDDNLDGIWKTDEGNPLCISSSRDNPKSSCGSASLPECPSQRPVSRGPIIRSSSVDESRQSSLSRLGGLLQRSFSQNKEAYPDPSSESRTESRRWGGAGRKVENQMEGQLSTSAFISFFRRIGGKNKPASTEEQNFKGLNT